jgi:hypothetical protein
VDTIWQDLRYAVRQLAKRPAFTAVAVLTLALGVGTSTAIFTVANGVLLRPLPYADPDRLVMLWETTPQLSVMMVAYPDFLDWRSRSRAFDEVAVYNRYRSMNLTEAAEPERLAAAMGSANLFRTLGVQPALGRTFRDEEDQAGAARVAIISAGLWQRRFGGAADVVGRTITLDGAPYTIVGVTARTFQFAGAIDVWVPIGLAGLGAGLLAALATSRLLVGLLFGVRPADPLTFGAVTLLVVGAALVASYLPARRAASVDPLTALRSE